MDSISPDSSRVALPQKLQRQEQAKGVLKVTLCALIALAFLAGMIVLTIAFPHIMVPINISLVLGLTVGCVFMNVFRQPGESRPSCRSCLDFIKRW